MDLQTIWHLSDSTYLKLKWIAMVFMPLFITFVGLVLTTLGVPKADLIISLMAGFNTMLGGLVMKSTSEYNKKQGGEEDGNTKE